MHDANHHAEIIFPNGWGASLIDEDGGSQAELMLLQPQEPGWGWPARRVTPHPLAVHYARQHAAPHALDDMDGSGIIRYLDAGTLIAVLQAISELPASR